MVARMRVTPDLGCEHARRFVTVLQSSLWQHASTEKPCYFCVETSLAAAQLIAPACKSSTVVNEEWGPWKS